MSFKRSATSMALALMALSIISITSIQQNAFAQDTGMSISATASEGSDTISVSGHTRSQITDITFTVISPGLNVVSVDQFAPILDSNGHFLKDITTGGPLWNQDGQYTIVAQQGDDPKYKHSIEVGIKDGVVIPEFGTIAVMILAVAIISIIAVSAKSR